MPGLARRLTAEYDWTRCPPRARVISSMRCSAANRGLRARQWAEGTQAALCERDDPHIGKAQSLVETGNILLIATHAIQRLGVNEIKLAFGGIRHQGKNTGHTVGAGNGAIRVNMNHLVSIPLNAFTADPHLIID